MKFKWILSREQYSQVYMKKKIKPTLTMVGSMNYGEGKVDRGDDWK